MLFSLHRWGIWADVASWWLKMGEDLRKFLRDADIQDKNELLKDLLTTRWTEKRGWMVFAIEITKGLVDVVNISQRTTEPTGMW